MNELAKGQLVVNNDWQTGVTWTQNAENVIYSWSATADAGDRFWTYIRIKFGGASLAGGSKWLEWYAVRFVIAEGTPDLSTASVREQFQRDKRILKRGSFYQVGANVSGVKTVALNLRNVRIPDGERLAILMINRSGTSADFWTWTEVEAREITIS